MLQTQLKSNSSNNACENGVTPETDAQANIVKKLEELNKWQEQQKKLLDLRQTMQRQMLGIEQQALYQTLGLHQNGSDTTLVEADQNAEGEENCVCQETEQLVEYAEESTEESIESSQLEEEIPEGAVNKDTSSCTPLTTCWDTQKCKETLPTKPKRPFLKRGEGLKQRFKMDPDEFRLNNLPKYKYVNAHPNLRFKPLKKSFKTADLRTKPASLPAAKAKTVVDHHKNLDAQERRFQNLLISSKNSCSSTPETKPSLVINKTVASLENNALARCEEENIQNRETVLPAKVNVANNKSAITKIVAWSKILDPLEVEPLQVPRNNKESLPQSEESIFELLEQKAQEGSFDMESTYLKEFMIRKINEKLNESNDTIPVNDQIKNLRLEPIAPAESLPEDHSSCYSDESDGTVSDETNHKTVETSSIKPNQHIRQVRVTFSNSNETHEYEEEPQFTVDESSRLSAGSCQSEVQGNNSQNDLFAQFKHALFAALQVKADQHLAHDSTVNSAGDDVTLTDENFSDNCDISNSVYTPFCKELQEKTDMIKTRLADLEKEIKFFKENNILLLKAKQEHELQKSLIAQEHLEAMESLKDEKIRMEIYLHDERMKLEDEKRQFEQNVKMKTQGIIAKERKECERLKEQVYQLEMQLKNKETNHTAAQARLRTQLRNLEKEQSKLHEQIENLTKENKKLENENLKISREQNNKILLEINRNIAKLAPKQVQQTNFPMPDEGPPTLAASRTMSKSVVAAATNNIKHGKFYKALSARPSNVQQQQANYKISPASKDKERETTPETNFVEATKQHQHNQVSVMSLDEQEEEEDDDDVIKEFQLTPEKRNKTPLRTETHNGSCNQKAVPEPPPSSPRSCAGTNMKREIVNADGSKDIWYPNGNLKKISADGMIIRMLYYNKDIKETNINEGTVKYYYAETNTWHTSYLDGLEILEFPNGQVEHRRKNGIVEVHYPNNSVKIVNPNDEHKLEEWRFPNGTHLVQLRNGDKILSLPNGQKEIHNKLHKRREYPDGTVKIVYPDGSTETRYSNGRVRLKDVEGKLVMDTDMAK